MWAEQQNQLLALLLFREIYKRSMNCDQTCKNWNKLGSAKIYLYMFTIQIKQGWRSSF